MIASNYIYNILSLLCDGDDAGMATSLQLPYLTEEEYLYTASGLFVSFKHLDGISEYKFQADYNVVNGVKVKSSTPHLEAEAQFFLKDGLIDYLEIWCYDGDYPKEELTSYVLTQEWMGSPGKTISYNANE